MRLLDGVERDGDVVVVEEAVLEPQEHRLEETGPVVSRGRVERDPSGEERSGNYQREPKPKHRRQRWCQREQHGPEPVRPGHRALEPEPDERDQHGREGGDGDRPSHARS